MSTTETMTVHEALCALKMLDKRIPAEITAQPWAVTNKHINKVIDGKSIGEFEEGIKGRYTKVTDLLRRQFAIKCAVTKSNATTTVEICGKTYTIAEAIWMKNHAVEFVQTLGRKMLGDYNLAKRTADVSNGESLEKRADANVEVTFGKTDMRGNAAEAQAVRVKFIEDQTLDVINPLNIIGKVDAIDDWVAEFLTKVDSALSVSNAKTEITVEY